MSFRILKANRRVRNKHNITVVESVDITIDNKILSDIVKEEVTKVEDERVKILQGEILILNGEISRMIVKFDELKKGLIKEVEQII